MKKLFYFSFLMIFFFGCSEEDEKTEPSCSYDAEIITYNNALSAYVSSQSMQNCFNLKSAAINLITALNTCGATDPNIGEVTYYSQLNCDNTNPNPNQSGKVTFWINQDFGCGTITVNIGGYSAVITSYYGNVTTCDVNGCANFTLPAGNYNFTASCTGKNWAGTVTVTPNGCFKMQLTQ